MLYVFQVDIGHMMILEMSLALKSVEHLREALALKTKIPVDKQVLLVSGGVALFPDENVSCYSAGTDTNPIFLFSMTTIESDAIYEPAVPEFDKNSFKERIDSSLRMPVSINTIASRTQLAHNLNDYAREVKAHYERLIQDQHMQQQGWAAVVANLEDIGSVLISKCEGFKKYYHDYLKMRREYLSLVENIENDIELMSRVPLLSSLVSNLPTCGSIHTPLEEILEQKPSEKVEGDGNSLLSWFFPNKERENLKLLAEQCHTSLNQFDSCLLQGIENEMKVIHSEACQTSRKEISGMETRLSTLEDYLQDGEVCMDDLTKLNESAGNIQIIAMRKSDVFILPDLCTQQQEVLSSMLKKFQELVQIRYLCCKAKGELSENIINRLRWIMKVEDRIHDMANNIHMYGENLKRLTNRLLSLQQVHDTPSCYVLAVAETFRRRMFSEGFLQWAVRLSSECRIIYERELSLRQQFAEKFSSNLAVQLFRCLEDAPSSYASDNPRPFDESLPKLTAESLDLLRKHVPEMSHLLHAPDTCAVPPLIQIGLQQDNARTLTLGDQPESETDTEGFVKVMCSTSDGTYSPMEAEAEYRGNKSKRQFCSHSADSKHIKLDKFEGREMEKSPEMGSSCAHLELQKELDDKELSIEGLQHELSSSRTEIDGLKRKLNLISTLNIDGALEELKREVERLKEEVLTDGQEYLKFMSQFSSRLREILEKIQKQAETDRDSAISDAIKATIADQEVAGEELKSKVELKTHQLKDAHREIGFYQDEINNQKGDISCLKTEYEDMKTRLKVECDGKIKQLTIEHEIALELQLDQWKMDNREKIGDVDSLVEKLKSAEEQLKKVEGEKNSLEENFEKRRKIEKEKIVQILETSFNERERKSIEIIRERLEKEHSGQISDALEAKEKEIARMHAKEIEEMLQGLRKENDQDIIIMQTEMETRLNAEHAAILEKAKQQYRLDLEALRSRFRMMTTASVDHSPTSESPTERIEKGDFIASSAHEAALRQLRQELQKDRQDAVHEAEETQRLIAEETVAKNDLWWKHEMDVLRMSKQELINETCRNAIKDKDRIIGDLTEEMDQLRGRAPQSVAPTEAITEHHEFEVKCKSYKEKIKGLEKELNRVKKLSFVSEKPPDLEAFGGDGPCRSPSAVPLDPYAVILKLQDENQELKNSMKSASTGRQKVSLHSCTPEDVVLLVWDEFHSHYRVLLEGLTHLHFLHNDSYDALGLSKELPHKAYCTAEVVKKELCQAKKDENRFRVAKGTKFYRVLAAPYDQKGHLTGKKERHRKSSILEAPPPPPFPVVDPQESQISQRVTLPFSSESIKDSHHTIMTTDQEMTFSTTSTTTTSPAPPLSPPSSPSLSSTRGSHPTAASMSESHSLPTDPPAGTQGDPDLPQIDK